MGFEVWDYRRPSPTITLNENTWKAMPFTNELIERRRQESHRLGGLIEGTLTISTGHIALAWIKDVNDGYPSLRYLGFDVVIDESLPTGEWKLDARPTRD